MYKKEKQIRISMESERPRRMALRLRRRKDSDLPFRGTGKYFHGEGLGRFSASSKGAILI